MRPDAPNRYYVRHNLLNPLRSDPRHLILLPITLHLNNHVSSI